MVAAAATGILVAFAFVGLTSRSQLTRTSANRLRSIVLAHPDGGTAGASTAGMGGGSGSGAGVVTGVVVGIGSGRLLGAVDGIVAGLAFGCLAAFAVLRIRAECAERGAVGAARRVVGCTPPAAALPAALDLLAACLWAGAPLEQALTVVSQAFEGTPAGRLLDATARLTALGAPPELAWADALADPAFAVVARAVIRAHHSGASLSDVLSRAADERRRGLRSDAEAAAARASVRAVLPLGLCFLPAFVLVGVVPVVAGFAGSLRI